MVLAFLTAASQENKKTKETKKDVSGTNKNQKEAKADSEADYQKFKMDAERNIAQNKKKIAELKTEKKSIDKEIEKKYKEKILALEQKNDKLKKKLENSGKTKTTMWTSFKKEFNFEMEELGQAIKDFGIDSMK
jgi:hypothetical protein